MNIYYLSDNMTLLAPTTGSIRHVLVDDAYGALGSCAAGTDGLPQPTSWSSASSDATVSW